MALSEFEINTFIERMEEIGDEWEPEDVQRVYGNMSLDEALADRMNDIGMFANIISTILNHGE